MTVDREQIRRHAEPFIGSEHVPIVGRLADHCLELLAELEQAEACLAKVPALVEAVREMLDRMETCDEPGCEAEQHITYEIKDALAAWDADQPDPDPTP